MPEKGFGQRDHRSDSIYGYGRTDKKDQPRVPITARLIADLLTVAGANRLLTVDLHADLRSRVFQYCRWIELTALTLLQRLFQTETDRRSGRGGDGYRHLKRARDMAARMNAPLAIVEKRRLGNAGKTEALNVIGDVKVRLP